MRHHRLYLGLIGLCALGFIPLDWSRLLLRPANLDVSPTSNALKLAVSFLAAVLAWRSAGRGLSAEDERAVRRLFTLIFIADVCFMVHLEPVGIALFAGVQALLVRRNAAGWRGASERLQRARPGLLGLSGAVALSLVATVIGIYRLQGFTPLLAVIIVYVSLLWASVSSAWAAVAIGRLPEPNARLLAVGMLCFLACDITVAGNLALPVDSLARVVTSSLTWMFYAPALVLIALSAHAREAPASAPLGAAAA